jgi:hypothetical protein
VVIYSFDSILRMPRQMHSFELLPGRRVPLPRAVPWISAVYFAVIELALILTSHVISFVGVLSGAMGVVVSGDVKPAAFLISYVLVPAGLTWISMNVEIDGRAPHRWIVSAARYVKRPKRRVAGCKARSEGFTQTHGGRVRIWWDEAAPRLQHGWVTGGRVSSCKPATFTHALRHRRLVMRAHRDGELVHGHEVEGQLEVRP